MSARSLPWHKEILSPAQVRLLPLLKVMNIKFGLVGGTAIALHIGHRRSIDFDLFSYTGFRNSDLEKKITPIAKITEVFVDKAEEYTFMCGEVKITFYHFYYDIKYSERLDAIIRLPDLLTLAAMKAFALGRRGKWKDYVDLYFIIKDFYSLAEISEKSQEIFGAQFNEKLFRIQLAYFEDVNYEELVEFLPGFEVSDATIKKALAKFSVS